MTFTQAFTRSAEAPPVMATGVDLVVGVVPWAMCLARVVLARAAATVVLCASHGFEMVRAYAERRDAQVIKFKSFGDRAYGQFVRIAVGHLVDVCPRFEQSVAGVRFSRSPQPATLRLVHFRPEPLLWRDGRSQRRKVISTAPPLHVVGVAQPARVQGSLALSNRAFSRHRPSAPLCKFLSVYQFGTGAVVVL